MGGRERTGDEIHDGIAAGDHEGAALGVGDFRAWVDAHEVVDGGGDVVGGDGIFCGFAAGFVGRAVDEAAFHAAAGEEDGVALGPVVAGGAGVDFWGAAEFAHPDDEGFVEHAALFEVEEEGGEGLFGDGEVVLFDDGEHAGIVEAVGVPAALGGALAADAFAEVAGDEADAAFCESAGEEAALAVGGAAVAVADGRGFCGELEGVADAWALEHGEGFLIVLVEAAGFGAVVHEAALGVDELLEAAAVVEAVHGEALGEAELREVEGVVVGVGGDEERVVLFAEEAGELAGDGGAVADDVGVADVGWEGWVFGGEEVVGDAAVAWEEVDGFAETLVVGGRAFAGEGVVACGVVIGHVVVDGADDGDLVHDAGGEREPVIDVDVRAGGAHGAVRAAELVCGVGFHVEGFEVGGAAPLEEEDDAAGAGSGFGAVVLAGGAEDFREGEAHHAGEAGTDEAAAAHCESAVETWAGGGGHGMGSIPRNGGASGGK